MEECDDEINLDSLLGPKEDKNKFKMVILGANTVEKEKEMQKRQREASKKFVKEEVDPSKIKVMSATDGRKQVKITAVKKGAVQEEDEEAKTKRAEEKKRQREEAEREKQTVEEKEKRARAEKELKEATEFLENLEKETKKKQEEQAKKFEEEYLLKNDGTELPATIGLSEQEWARLNLASNTASDDAFADAIDKSINVQKYYADDLFPVNTVVAFVTQAGQVPLENCELGFVIGKAWWRNQRFVTANDFRNFLISKKPERIDIGPVHPSHATTNDPRSNLFLKRYLVFDLDVTDKTPTASDGYFRACKCKGSASVCGQGCWFYVRAGIKVLVYLLRTCFGAEHVMPVYSGRRGVHVYALDKQFLELQERERKGLIERIQLYANPGQYVHPEHTTYILEFILRPEFEKAYLGDGNSPLIKDEAVLLHIKTLAGGTLSRTSSDALACMLAVQRERERKLLWKVVCDAIDKQPGQIDHGIGTMTKEEIMLKSFETRFIFSVMFPRLDTNVTSGMHHCVKAPFVVHPGSKRFSVPIPDVEQWKPEMAPRISEVVGSEELEKHKPEWQKRQDAEKRVKVLQPYTEHVYGLVNAAYPPKKLVAPVTNNPFIVQGVSFDKNNKKGGYSHIGRHSAFARRNRMDEDDDYFDQEEEEEKEAKDNDPFYQPDDYYNAEKHEEMLREDDSNPGLYSYAPEEEAVIDNHEEEE